MTTRWGYPDILKSAAEEMIVSGKKRRKLQMEDKTAFLTLERRKVLGKDITYVIQRIENEFYGWALLQWNGEFVEVPGYPHLKNLKPEMLSPDERVVVEVKFNGTNIGIMKLPDGTLLWRTRRTLFPNAFPVPALMKENMESLPKKAKERLEEIVEKGKNYSFFIVEGDGEYVAINVPRVLEFLHRKYPLIDSPPDGKMLFFEVYGRYNPIPVDEKMRLGMYSEPMDAVLIDVKDGQRWLGRKEKELLARNMNLKVVPAIEETTAQYLFEEREKLGRIAVDAGWEGYVIKTEENTKMIKLKPEEVLSFARRGYAIMKGFIAQDDLITYVNRALESVNYDFSRYEDAVQIAFIEALADYPENIVEDKRGLLEYEVAKEMAKMWGLRRAEELLSEGKDVNCVLKTINEELPRNLPFLKKWFSDEERRLKEAGDPRWRELQKRRKKIINPVARFIISQKKIQRKREPTEEREN